MKGVGETTRGQIIWFWVWGENLGQNGDKNLPRAKCGESGWKTLTLRPKKWWLGRWKVAYLEKMRVCPSHKPHSPLVQPKDPLQMNQGDLLFIVLVAHVGVTRVTCLALRAMWSCNLWRSWGHKFTNTLIAAFLICANQWPVSCKVARVTMVVRVMNLSNATFATQRIMVARS